MPSKMKRSAAAELPAVPKKLIDQFVTGAPTARALR
jgi:hypothetical protein